MRRPLQDCRPEITVQVLRHQELKKLSHLKASSWDNQSSLEVIDSFRERKRDKTINNHVRHNVLFRGTDKLANGGNALRSVDAVGSI